MKTVEDATKVVCPKCNKVIMVKDEEDSPVLCKHVVAMYSGVVGDMFEEPSPLFKKLATPGLSYDEQIIDLDGKNGITVIEFDFGYIGGCTNETYLVAFKG